MEYEILDLGLVYYKNLVKNPSDLIKKVEELDAKYLSDGCPSDKTIAREWAPWSSSPENGVLFCYQKFIPEVIDIDSTDKYKKEQTEISIPLYSALDSAVRHYSTELYPFAKSALKSRETRMHLLKYEQSGYLPAHQDKGISTRILSVLMYLNDDYEGGEIEFRHSGVKIKPEAGSILFFPSNFLYVHEVHPVTKGPRYALPNWYHNVPNMERTDSNGNE